MEDTSLDSSETMQKFNKLPKDKQKWIVDQIKKETASFEKSPATEGTLSAGPSEPTSRSGENANKPQGAEEQKSEITEETIATETKK